MQPSLTGIFLCHNTVIWNMLDLEKPLERSQKSFSLSERESEELTQHK
jgi:hypothetical protein